MCCVDDQRQITVTLMCLLILSKLNLLEKSMAIAYACHCLVTTVV